VSTARSKVIDDCMRFSAWVAPYVDGELDPGHAVEMEAHVVGCATCAERVALIRAMRVSLKRTAALSMPAASVDFRSRMQSVIDGERCRAIAAHAPRVANDGNDANEPKMMKLRYAVGLAAAAGVLFSMGMSRYFQAGAPVQAHAPGSDVMTGDSAAVMSIDGVLEELIALHARPFPPDTTDPDQLGRFDPLLGVQVRRPMIKPLGVAFNGARVHPVSDRGALLQVQYSVPDGRHFTMYVFNPRVLPVQTSRLEPRMVRHRPMLVGRLRGYSVAALEQSGVGYAYASDLDTDESTKIMAAALP
jgi:anti-sigma factor RsiW